MNSLGPWLQWGEPPDPSTCTKVTPEWSDRMFARGPGADALSWMTPKMRPTQLLRRARMVLAPFVAQGKNVSLVVPNVGTLYAGAEGWIVHPIDTEEEE